MWFVISPLCLTLTCESPACSVPPGPVKSSSLLVQMWSRKSSITFWFSSVPMKRFHLSVFTRSTQKACSLRKSTLSSDNTIPTLRDGTWGVCAPVLLVLKPPLSLLELLVSAMKTPEEKLKLEHLCSICSVNNCNANYANSENVSWASPAFRSCLFPHNSIMSSCLLSSASVKWHSPIRIVEPLMWQHATFLEPVWTATVSCNVIYASRPTSKTPCRTGKDYIFLWMGCIARKYTSVET